MRPALTGVALVDAPLSGGPKRAGEGNLLIAIIKVIAPTKRTGRAPA